MGRDNTHFSKANLHAWSDITLSPPNSLYMVSHIALYLTVWWSPDLITVSEINTHIRVIISTGWIVSISKAKLSKVILSFWGKLKHEQGRPFQVRVEHTSSYMQKLNSLWTKLYVPIQYICTQPRNCKMCSLFCHFSFRKRCEILQDVSICCSTTTYLNDTDEKGRTVLTFYISQPDSCYWASCEGFGHWVGHVAKWTGSSDIQSLALSIKLWKWSQYSNSNIQGMDHVDCLLVMRVKLLQLAES